MYWWILIGIAAGVLVSLYGLFRWASADAGVDAEIAGERFRAEQDLRALRRYGNDADLTGSHDRLQKVR